MKKNVLTVFCVNVHDNCMLFSVRASGGVGTLLS